MSRPCASAQRSSLFVCAALGVGIALSGAVPASAASGSSRPKPQVLWHAYPLDSTKTRVREVHDAKPGTAGTKPASAPAEGQTAAPRAGGTLSTGHLAALLALAAGVVGVLLLLMRRRAGARPRGEEDRSPDDSPARRGIMDVLAQEDGMLAPAARRKRRGGGPAEEDTAAALAAQGATTESVAPSSKAVVVHPNRVEPQPESAREEARPSAEEKAAPKHTGEYEDAEAAKLKPKVHAAKALKDARQRDLTALKAKLSQPPDAKRMHPAKPTPSPPKGGTVRPIVDTDVEERKPRTHCHIEWRPNGDESMFCALSSSATREETALLRSPPFPWSKDVPPSKYLPQAGNAYRALVSELVADGWVATGNGAHWYELELERPAANSQATNRQKGST
jgi:hypothetical protein